jgi:hypothetical protein
MAGEVRVLNRAPASIFVETGRLAPYSTAKVSKSWYHGRIGNDRCLSVETWLDELERWDASRLYVECRNAGIDPGDAEHPADLRALLLEEVGLDYRESDLIQPHDPPREKSPDWGAALELEWGDKLQFVAEHRDEPIPDDERDTESLDAWIRDQMDGE